LSRRNDLSPEGLALTGMVMLRTGDNRSAQVAPILESKVSGRLPRFVASMHNPLLDIDDDNSAESTAFALRFLTHADSKARCSKPRRQWLVVNRTGGYWWNSTEQTAMVLFAWWTISPLRRS